jgi:2TM domain
VSDATGAGSSGGIPEGVADRPARARRVFRRHAALFLVANLALNVANIFVGSGWWAFWPLAAWGMVFMIHYLRYKAATVDEEWVESRATELRLKSYDREHIDNIVAHGPGAAARESEAEPK